ncbi:MAG: hypothetical protein AAB359_02145 [Elusimicrobiota bacterium]
MNDNLPEIGFKEKKERKGGAFGWLRSKIGGGSSGAMGIGAAKFGASGLLAGKAGTIALAALMAVAGGIYLTNNAPAPTTGAFKSGKVDNYVPAILRGQTASQGSSLDMFKDTNSGAGLAMEAEPARVEEGAPNQPDPGQGNMQDMMGKLQGGSMDSLTSSLGGGSSKFSGMGGFGNKFGQGTIGAKTGFSSGIGAGFPGMPKFDQRKGNMLAMRGSARPVFSGAKGGKGGSMGSKSRKQLDAVRKTQKSYIGSNIDSARSTQDKAWEGSTSEGDADSGGAGLGEGGAGVMTSPSLDSSSGNTGTSNDPVVSEVTGNTDVSPWNGLPELALALIVASILMSALASYLISLGKAHPVLKAAGYALAAAALVMAIYATYIGLQIMTEHGQSAMGAVYMLGGGLAAAAAILAFSGKPIASNSMQLALAAMAAAAALIGVMMGGK